MGIGPRGKGRVKWRWVGMGTYGRGKAVMGYLTARRTKDESHMALWRPTFDRDSIAKTEITRATGTSIT